MKSTRVSALVTYLQSLTVNHILDPSKMGPPSLQSLVTSTAAQVTEKLEDLSCDETTVLLRALKARNAELEQELQHRRQETEVAKDELTKLKETLYVIRPSSHCQRLNDEECAFAESVASKWLLESPSGTHGNYGLYGVDDSIDVNKVLMWSDDEKKFVQGKEEDLARRRRRLIRSVVISSQDVLYRLICLFADCICYLGMGERYKSIWGLELWHHKTGFRIRIYEAKGCANINYPDEEQYPYMDSETAADYLELLNLICSDRVPHPYDGCRAGSVA